MRLTLALLVVAACGSPLPVSHPTSPAQPPPALIIRPKVCGQVCNSNVECGGVVVTCKFCNFGTCKQTRPELWRCRLACEVPNPPPWCTLGGCGDVMRKADR